MAIQASAQPTPIVTPNPGLPFVDPKTGNLSGTGRIALQQMRDFIVNMNRGFPCNASGTNVITLTLLQVQPEVNQYASYDDYLFIAAHTSTGPVTAKVTTAEGTLAEKNVYLGNGAQADTGDIVADKFYRFTFIDALNSGGGGFLLTYGGSVITGLTDSTTGVASGVLVDTGTASINNNFASINAKLDTIISALTV